jgi:hypothetical protein
MARRLIDYEVLVDGSGELDKLIQQKIDEGWEVSGTAKVKR